MIPDRLTASLTDRYRLERELGDERSIGTAAPAAR